MRKLISAFLISFFGFLPLVFADSIRGTSGKMFNGEKIVVVSISGDQGEYLKKIANAWEEQTGASVELNLIPFGELQDKVSVALTAGTYVGDILNLPAYLGGDLMGNGYIEEVGDLYKGMDLKRYY